MEVYGEYALAELTCQKWFARFKTGDFGLEDEERPGPANEDYLAQNQTFSHNQKNIIPKQNP